MDPNPIREIQVELDLLIQQGVLQITRLLKNSNKEITFHSEEELYLKGIPNN